MTVAPTEAAPSADDHGDEPAVAPAPPVPSLGDDESPDVGALEVLRRGLALSPELRTGIVLTVAMALLAATGRLIVPILVQQILDNGILADGGYRAGFVQALSAAAVAVVVAVIVASRTAYIRLVTTAENVLLGLRVRTFDHIHRLSLADHTQARTGALTARVTSDVETLAQFAQWGAIAWIVDLTIIAGALAVMAVYSWELTLVVIAVHLPMVPFLRWVQRRQFVAYGLVRTRVAETLGHTSEAVGGAPVIRSYGYDARVRTRLDEAIDRQYGQQLRAHVWFASILPTLDLVSSASLAVSVAVGATWGPELGLGTGELVAFLFLVSLLLQPISELGEVLDQTQTALAGWWKIQRVLDVPVEVEEPDPGVALPEGPLAVRLERVSFAYRTGPPVLRDVDVVIEPETSVAVVGETGSGKTTFSRLLARLADPSSGVVRVGGVDLRLVAPGSRRSAIRMVPQDGFLFDTTVAENIRFGRRGAGDDDVAAAVADLGLSAWVAGLPEGLDTVVGERGGRLSVGERQLVALARAHLADPGLLLLDEATSAVDPETEEALAVALASLAEGRTTVAVAHRLSTAERADLVLVFDRGRVVERGSHAELVAAGGVYAGLHRSWIGNTRRSGSDPAPAP